MRKLWLGILGLAAASTANAAIVTYTISLHETATGAVTTANQYVVYSTCSLEPEENDEVVKGYERADVASFVNAEVRRWVENGVLRLTPESGADGFTAFVLNIAPHAT